MKINKDAESKMNDIENEVREVSRVKFDTMLIVDDQSGDTLDCAVIFIKAGDSAYDAIQECAMYGGIKNAHERSRIALPDNFDAESVYWNHAYIG